MSYAVSLGNATNSLVDTAARHTFVYRICTDMYNSLVDPNLVVANKGDFRTARFEIALSIGRAFNTDLGVSPVMSRKGPAPVITNVAPFSCNRSDDLMSWYIKWYDCRSHEEMKRHKETTCIVKGQSYFPSELNFAGFVLSDAQGHPMNGDTAVTLFVGGMITIRNGRFRILAEQEVHWYFEEEADAGVFDKDGLRVPRSQQQEVDPQQQQQGDHEPTTTLDQQSLKIRSHPYGERALTKKIIYVKPYIPGILGVGSTLLDKRRVLGIAKADAGPFEYVDLKICRQSM